MLSPTGLQPVERENDEVMLVGDPADEAIEVLQQRGLDPTSVDDAEQAAQRLPRRPRTRAVVLCLCDEGDPWPDSAEVEQALQALKSSAPLAEVVLWSDSLQVGRLAGQSIPTGAADHVQGGGPDRLATELQEWIRDQSLLPRLLELDPTPRDSLRFEQLTSVNDDMWQLFDVVRRVAPSEAPVLILGETGTGKELVARAVHQRSGRRGPFVPFNCGGIPPELVQAELFGHVKGSFSGASQSRPGLLRSANTGTAFMDELGNLPADAQASLLRALQEKVVRPVGASRGDKVDTRIVAATSSNLDRAVETGAFRRDLLYRLDVIRLVLPPLRDRPDDVLLLFGSFVTQAARRHGVSAPEFDDDFVEALLSYPWPGNVRELHNFAERAVLTEAGRRLGPETWDRLASPYAPAAAGAWAEPTTAAVLPRPAEPAPPLASCPPDAELTLAAALRSAEARYLRGQLARFQGDPGQVAAAAGISRRTLYRKLRAHRINRREFKSRNA